MFALEMDKSISVAAKMVDQVDTTFRRPVRRGIEYDQLNDLRSNITSVSLSLLGDRWICNISDDGMFRVKDIRNCIDELILPTWPEPTQWVKYIPIKINIFGWRAQRDCLPTRANLIRRGVALEWWDLDWQPWFSFSTWETWFSSIKLAPNNKKLLEGVFYIAWWSIWVFRNRLLFDDKFPSREDVGSGVGQCGVRRWGTKAGKTGWQIGGNRGNSAVHSTF
nr:RNA-directed DNA polymerase, eukaryota [Tanacetum cinerariifolium]